MYDHDNRIIIECQVVFFLEDLTINPRDTPWQVESYEITKAKGILASGGFDVRTLEMKALARSHLRKNSPLNQLVDLF